MTSLSNIETVFLPKKLANKTQLFLRTVGQSRKEGLALWVGSIDGRTFRITNILVPRQRGIRSDDGVCVVVSSEEMLRINMELHQSGLFLIGQIHSHPTEAFHSEMDDENAIANRVGSLSLVVPDFAAADFSIATCAVYRLSADGTWNNVPTNLAIKLIQLTEE